MNVRLQESYRLSVPGSGEIQVSFSHLESPAAFAVVYVHGFGSTRGGEKAVALEAACSRRGWAYASFDFRGHGESTGTMLELRGSALLEDLEAVQADLARRGIRRLYPVGSSMGGWAAAWFTLRHPKLAPACAVMAPALDFVRHRWGQLSDEEKNNWKKFGRHRVQNEWVDTEIGYCLVEEADQFPVEKLTAEWTTPLLIFHGLQDDTVCFRNSLEFVERTTFPDVELRLFKNADHRLLALKDEMAEAACEFFRRRGAGA